MSSTHKLKHDVDVNRLIQVSPLTSICNYVTMLALPTLTAGSSRRRVPRAIFIVVSLGCRL